MFQDVIVGAGAHRLDRRFFADRARDDDERNIGVVRAQQVQRIHRAEALHRVVAQDHVPRAFFDGRQELGASLGHPGLDLKAMPGQLEADQLDIVSRVLDKEHTKAGRGALRHVCFFSLPCDEHRSTLK